MSIFYFMRIGMYVYGARNEFGFTFCVKKKNMNAKATGMETLK